MLPKKEQDPIRLHERFRDVHVYTAETISHQVDKIRAEIKLHGFADAGCDELALLCPGVDSGEARRKGIAQIIKWEHWDIEFLPDNAMRFSNL